MNRQYALFRSLPVMLIPTSRGVRYQAYLRSAKWSHIRKMTLIMAGYKCEAQMAGCWDDANVAHHLNYDHWESGNDMPGEDTMAVCYSCHHQIHFGRPLIAANDNYQLDLDEGEAA